MSADETLVVLRRLSALLPGDASRVEVSMGEVRALLAHVDALAERAIRAEAAVDTQMARAAGLAGRLGQIAAIARPAG